MGQENGNVREGEDGRGGSFSCPDETFYSAHLLLFSTKEIGNYSATDNVDPRNKT